MLHEARRDEKRRLQDESESGAGLVSSDPRRKKSDAEYHEPCDRSEFYHMSNLHKPPVIFNPPEDFDPRAFGGAMEGFYALPPPDSAHGAEAPGPSSRPLDHNHNGGGQDALEGIPPPKRPKIYPQDRILIYVRQPDEGPFTPLHIHPPSLQGLHKAIGEKYPHLHHLAAIYKGTRKGHCVKLDDAMVRLYSNEDAYILSAQANSPRDPSQPPSFTVTLQEFSPPSPVPPAPQVSHGGL